jgi:hypothetical protein
MRYKYLLHEHAQQDYETSLEWYIERSEQAAKLEHPFLQLNKAQHL